MAVHAYAKGGANEPKSKPSSKLPICPNVLSVYVPNSAAEANFAVPVPWRNCRLAHASATVITAIDTVAVMSIDLELNAAGGTGMIDIDVTGAAGSYIDGTVVTGSACNNLDRDDDNRNVINVEVDGSTTGTGACMLYLYFEEALSGQD